VANFREPNPIPSSLITDICRWVVGVVLNHGPQICIIMRARPPKPRRKLILRCCCKCRMCDCKPLGLACIYDSMTLGELVYIYIVILSLHSKYHLDWKWLSPLAHELQELRHPPSPCHQCPKKEPQVPQPESEGQFAWACQRSPPNGHIAITGASHHKSTFGDVGTSLL